MRTMHDVSSVLERNDRKRTNGRTNEQRAVARFFTASFEERRKVEEKDDEKEKKKNLG